MHVCTHTRVHAHRRILALRGGAAWMWKMEAKGHSRAACESNGIVTIDTGKRFVYEEPLGTCDPYELVVKKSCAAHLCSVWHSVPPTRSSDWKYEPFGRFYFVMLILLLLGVVGLKSLFSVTRVQLVERVPTI
jgi:hypothetical protein